MICLLDLDGTLIDSAGRHRLLMGQLLKQYCPKQAGDFDPAGYMAYKADGHSGKQYLTEILHLDKEKAKEIQERWQARIEEEMYLDTDDLLAGTVIIVLLSMISGKVWMKGLEWAGKKLGAV